MILKNLHQTNDTSQNLSGIILFFYSIAMYFIDFWFRFRYFRKMVAKFQFHSNRFKIFKFKTWQWQKLKKSISQLPRHGIEFKTELDN
jgi:hypothetical protein